MPKETWKTAFLLNIELQKDISLSVLCGTLTQHGIEPQSIRYSSSRLEELFIKLTKKKENENV